VGELPLNLLSAGHTQRRAVALGLDILFLSGCEVGTEPPFFVSSLNAVPGARFGRVTTCPGIVDGYRLFLKGTLCLLEVGPFSPSIEPLSWEDGVDRFLGLLPLFRLIGMLL